MLKILVEKNFKQDLKKFKNNQKLKDLINEVILKITQGEQLDTKYKNHLLKGGYINCYDCHIKPDLVLIYRINNNCLKLVRIGSHSDLFD